MNPRSFCFGVLGLALACCFAAACADAPYARPRAPRPSGGARPAASSSSTDAQRSMELGARLQSEKSFAEAILAYEQAYRLGHDPRALIGAAQCYRATRRPAMAYETYERILAAGDAELTAQQTQSIQQALTELGALTAMLALNVSETEAEVEVDNRGWGKWPTVRHHRVITGTHSVRVQKAGFSSFETDLTLAGGESRILDVKLVPDKGGVGGAGAPAAATNEMPDVEKRGAARAAYQEGVALQEKGKCAEAIGRFQAAQHLYEAPTHLLHLGQCLAATGKLLDAQEAYESLNRVKLDAQAPSAFVKAQETGRAELAVLKTRVPTLRLQTSPAPSTLEGLVIQVNGTRMPNELLGVARPMNPGSYRIQATAGALHATADVDLTERTTKSVEIRLLH